MYIYESLYCTPEINTTCKSTILQFENKNTYKKLNMQLPYDPAVAFLGIYPKRNKNTFSQKSTYGC